MFGEPFRRQFDCRDDFIPPQVSVDLWGVAGQTMKIGEWNSATTIVAGDVNDGVKRRQSDTHIRRMNRNTLIASTENCMYPVEALDGGTARARLALITRCGTIVEVVAARSLQQVSSVCSHIAELC